MTTARIVQGGWEGQQPRMVGGQFVAHPGGDGVADRVRITQPDHPIMAGLTALAVTSEQYYLHIDPAITVLATTTSGDMVLPVVWTKTCGRGRVFYGSPGQTPAVVRRPEVVTILTRGLLLAAWA